MTEVFSNGGGTQSVAAIALFIQGRLPRPDIVAIVDTEREAGTTWQYLDTVIRPALREIGIEVHRIKKSEWGSKPDHGKDYLSHNGNTVLLPAFTDQVFGSIGKLPGYCSGTWKVDTQTRYLREKLGIPTKHQRNWINFSLDEKRRAIRMMAREEYQAGRIYFPLIQGVPLSRGAAIQVVIDMGWPKPPRSMCWNCPNKSDAEWRATNPDEFRLACELEQEVRLVDPNIWFHRSCVPLSEVDFSEPEDLFADRACSSGGCFT